MCVVSGVSYWYSKSCKKKHEEMRKKSINKMVSSYDININTVNELVIELEKYMNRVKTFVTWSIGIFDILLVLIMGGMVNLSTKFLDIFVKGLKENELKVLLT